jgi:hypothetical protein
MTALTEADYARLSWHARQKLNRSLEQDIRRLTLEITLLDATRTRRLNAAAVLADELATTGVSHRPRPLTSEAQFLAAAMLELLPVDPDAATHRAEALRDRRRRKDTP